MEEKMSFWGKEKTKNDEEAGKTLNFPWGIRLERDGVVYRFSGYISVYADSKMVKLYNEFFNSVKSGNNKVSNEILIIRQKYNETIKAHLNNLPTDTLNQSCDAVKEVVFTKECKDEIRKAFINNNVKVDLKDEDIVVVNYDSFKES